MSGKRIDDLPVMTLREAALFGGPAAVCDKAVVVTTEVPGAWPNGTRVAKATFRPGDFYPVGSAATVLGSMAPPIDDGEFGYFVSWDAAPGIPVFIRGRKLRLL